jgi:diguanylate cyclase (GGDEF)-like protein
MIAFHHAAAVPALMGVIVGVLSFSLARRHESSVAYGLVGLDYLLLGTSLALAGGTRSWFVLCLPLLVFAHLALSPRATWPFLLTPVLLLTIVLAIADSSLGGNRASGLVMVFVLVAVGGVAAHWLTRPHRRQQVRAQSVDPTTGFYTRARLHSTLAAQLSDVTERHDSLSIVCLKLDHFTDTRAFLGAEGSERLVRAVAHRVERHLRGGDTAVRVTPDTFVLALPGRNDAEARAEAAVICHAVAAQLIDRRRQTMRSGVGSFPNERELEALLRAAYADMTITSGDGTWAAPQALPLAVAQ